MHKAIYTVTACLVLALAPAAQALEWKDNGNKATDPAYVGIGTLTLSWVSEPSATKESLTCHTLTSGNVAGLTAEVGSFSTRGCVSTGYYRCKVKNEPSGKEVEGDFLTAEEPPTFIHPGYRWGLNESPPEYEGALVGKTSLPWMGELFGSQLEPQQTSAVRLWFVDPCAPLEIPIQGQVVQRVVDGLGNGLSPTHVVVASSKLSGNAMTEQAKIEGSEMFVGERDLELLTAS